MMPFLEKIRGFMSGRNGMDRLSVFTFFLYFLLNGIKIFLRFIPIAYYSLWAVALAFLAFTVYRIFSKNIAKRRYEAERFENFLVRINYRKHIFNLRKKFKRMSVRIMQFKTHRFRTCPQCNEHLRLSKKRGIRKITCPICGRKFKAYILF